MTAEGVFQVTEYNPFIEGTRDQAAMRELLELHGTANQLERYFAGRLPDGELHLLARDVLYQHLDDFRRWIKLAPYDLMHRRGCHGDVTFATHEAGALQADEWELYKAIRDRVDSSDMRAVLTKHQAAVKVDIVAHVGTCVVCGAQCSGRSAAVKIEWAGRPFNREYSLEVE